MLKPGGPKQYYRVYKYKSIRRGIPFELSEQEFAQLIYENCFYCGVEPLMPIKSFTGTCSRNNNEELIQGIDRVDSDKPYIPGNVVPCCRVCNMVKGNLTIGGLLCHLPKMLLGLTSFVVRWKRLRKQSPIVKGSDISFALTEKNMNWYFARPYRTRAKRSQDFASQKNKKSTSTRQVNPLKKRSFTK